MDVAQTIINRLRSDLDRAHTSYILREGEWAAAQSGHYYWEQRHSDDVVNRDQPKNPFDQERDLAEIHREQAKQGWEELSVAHDYAVDHFINPRRFKVEVIGSHTYDVPAATRVDAQLIAFILDQGITPGW